MEASMIRFGALFAFRFTLPVAVAAMFSTVLLAADTPSMKSSITHFGITWTFDREYPAGRFASGDWWVVGPVRIVDIDPPSLTQDNGRIVNGSMINPQVSQNNGFDSFKSSRYRPELNVAMGISPQSPLNLPPGTSLLSSISFDDENIRGSAVLNPIPLESVSILTVLEAVPSADSFRPPYVDVDKTVRHSFLDVNTSLLPKLSVVGAPPSWESVATSLQRPHIDFAPGWDRAHTTPHLNNSNYGREISHRFDIATTMLISNYPLDQKEVTLKRFIQVGIDLYGVAKLALQSGVQPWRLDGGHSHGRKWPVIFAGAMLGDQSMKYFMENIPADRRRTWFQDDADRFYVTQEHVEATNSESWNPWRATIGKNAQPYTESMIGMPEWRGRTNPLENNANWGADSYRLCCMSNTVHGQALAIMAMGLKDAWGNDAYFDYQVRYTEIMAGRPDPFGEILGYGSVEGVRNQEYPGHEQWRFSKWRWDMWQEHWQAYHRLENMAQPRPPLVIVK
jgi:hypothetical protein